MEILVSTNFSGHMIDQRFTQFYSFLLKIKIIIYSDDIVVSVLSTVSVDLSSRTIH